MLETGLLWEVNSYWINSWTWTNSWNFWEKLLEDPNWKPKECHQDEPYQRCIQEIWRSDKYLWWKKQKDSKDNEISLEHKGLQMWNHRHFNRLKIFQFGRNEHQRQLLTPVSKRSFLLQIFEKFRCETLWFGKSWWYWDQYPIEVSEC